MSSSFSLTSSLAYLVIGISTILFLYTPVVFTESLQIHLDENLGEHVLPEDDTAPAQTVSADATLSDLTLAGISLTESFSPEETAYTAETDVSETTVSAVATHSAASISMPDDDNSETDGTQVVLAEGENVIQVTVTAEDTITTQTYTITVSRRAVDTQDGEDSDTMQVLLPDEQGSDTQSYTGKLTIGGLSSDTDSGVTGDQITNVRAFKLTASGPSAFPSDGNDNISFFKSSVSGIFNSRSCADSTPITQSISGYGFQIPGGQRWDSFFGLHAPNGATSVTTIANNIYISVSEGTHIRDGRHCFVAVYKPDGGSGASTLATHSDPFEIIIDTTRPTITVVEPATGSVYAYANETTTAKTKDNIAAENCTDSTSTVSGWSDYTLDGTVVSFSGSGRCFIFSDTAGNTKAAHTSAKVSGVAIVDYDSDDNNLIEIDGNNEEALAKLNVMRYDLDGNGIPDSPASAAAYRVGFPGTVPAGILFGCPSTCTGYELKRSLDLDTDGDGKTATGTVGYPTGDSDDAYYNGGIGWEPIGARTNRFQATFDGNGYTIDNLFVKRFRPAQTDVDAALFGAVGTGGIVRNLGCLLYTSPSPRD